MIDDKPYSQFARLRNGFEARARVQALYGFRTQGAHGGMGVVLAISLEELEQRRRLILDRYPGSAIANWRPYRPIRLPVVDLSTGIVLEADYPEPKIKQLELAI
jgi:hypothetical protein